jgi:hypothetical protein
VAATGPHVEMASAISDSLVSSTHAPLILILITILIRLLTEPSAIRRP